MEHTFHYNSMPESAEDRMIVYGPETAGNVASTYPDETSQLLTIYETEFDNFLWQDLPVNLGRPSSTIADRSCGRSSSPSWLQTRETWGTELTRSSTYQQMGDEMSDSRRPFFETYTPGVIFLPDTVSVSNIWDYPVSLRSEFPVVEQKMISRLSRNSQSNSPSGKQPPASSSSDDKCQAQKRFLDSYPVLVSHDCLHPTKFSKNPTETVCPAPDRLVIPEPEDDSGTSVDEFEDECLDERDQLDEVEELKELEELDEPPYSQLIYRAIMSSPKKQMRVREIYTWFERNTNKCGNPKYTGWQNSIRHNLSMNAGFVAVKESNPQDKRSYTVWRISEKALAEGIRSTTRYRKVIIPKNVARSQPPSPRRQKSGAKGGRRSAIAAKLRRLKGGRIASSSQAASTQIAYPPPRDVILAPKLPSTKDTR